MKKKTIIFFPIEIGLAHLTRSLAIASALKKKGHRIIFAVPERKNEFVKKAGIEPVLISEYSRNDDISFLTRMRDTRFLQNLVSEEVHLLDRFKPNISVIDFRLTAVASSLARNIPTVYLTGGGGLPYGCYLPNVGFPPFVHRFMTPLIQTVIWQAKKQFAAQLLELTAFLNKRIDMDTLFKKMHYIVPEQPSYLPPLNNSLKIHYVGPIFWDGFEVAKPLWLEKIKPTGKTIYVTFGGTGFDGRKLIEIASTLLKYGYTVVVSASHIADISDFPKHERLHVEKHLPGLEVCRKVDLVICHGGYGTLMQAALSGKPVIAIPFNPDQLLHAARFQELGLGISLHSFHPRFLLDFLRFDWQSFQNAGSTLNISRSLDAIKTIQKNYSAYQDRIRAYIKNISWKNSAFKAADIIEQL